METQSTPNCQQREEEQQLGEDFFDYIPDPILLLILNKIFDAKSLHQCFLVSKRFASLVPLVDSIHLDMNLEKTSKPIKDSSILPSGSNSISKNFIKNLFKFLGKPLQFILGKKQSTSNDGTIDFVNWVCSALKNFSEIQSLKLDLPCNGGEIGVRKTIPLLKWESQFGKELDSCLIVGANSIIDKQEKNAKVEDIGLNVNGENQQLFSDDELKMRIIWIISCLIASSARHNLLKRVVIDCPKLENAVITDVGKQGNLYMDAEQINELRDWIKNNPNNNQLGSGLGSGLGSETQMGYVGNLVMKLWYVKELELPCCGKVMKGATMVDIRKEGKVEREIDDNGLNLRRVFEGDDMFGEAAKELLRRKEKRMYRLEMNSF